MANNEKADGLKRVATLKFVSQDDESIFPAGVAGRVKLSGISSLPKLYIDDGSAWKLVTSA